MLTNCAFQKADIAQSTRLNEYRKEYWIEKKILYPLEESQEERGLITE